MCVLAGNTDNITNEFHKKIHLQITRQCLLNELLC